MLDNRCSNCPCRELPYACPARFLPHPRYCELAEDPGYRGIIRAKCENAKLDISIDKTPSNQPITQPSRVSVLNATKHFLGSVWEFARNGFETAPSGTYGDRLRVCSECAELDARTSQCGVCLCYVPLKASFPHEHCPLLKWEGDSELAIVGQGGGCGGCQQAETR